MKNSHIQFEPSLATKSLNLGTRKAPCILEKSIDPGYVHTANAGRDVSLMVTAFALEAMSLSTLWWMLPFHVGIVAGLAAFDTAGALLMHAGVADANLRAAKTAVAKTDEEKAAIAAQRPGYLKWLRVLGAFFIVGPLVFKIGSLLMLPFALQILGGLAPALMVAFVAIAVIHLLATGYALAHLRYRRAENRERLAMLRSAELPENRERHANHIKATRTHRFSTLLPLGEVEHTDGHSLRLEGVSPDGMRRYVLETWGRFDDPDLDFMVKGQHGMAEKTELCRQGLKHQLDIEQSEPLTSAKSVRATAEPNKLENETQPGTTQGIRAAAAVIFAAATLGLSACEPVKSEPVKMTFATTKPLAAAPGAALPESVLALLAPSAPLAKKYVPTGEVVRLDLADNNSESLAPQDTISTTQKAIERAWQIESPVVELAKAAEYLRGHGAGLMAKAGASLDAESTANRLVEMVARARSEGREVIAVSKAAKDGVVTIAKGVSVEARSGAKEACALIEEKLKAGAQPSVLVLLDPPIFDEAKPGTITRTEQAKTVDPETKPEQPETRMMMPGSSTTVIVNTPRDGKPEIAVQLPEGARRIGEPVLFANTSARLSGRASESIAAIAEAIKRSGFKRVILIASADASGSEKGNSELARHRGEVVAAAFLKAGVAVESVLSVGDSFAPEGAPASERKNYRAVCVYTVDAVTAASAASPWQ